jgi:hypothetical protein
MPGPRKAYWPVFSPMRASDVYWLIRPVSSAYRFSAAVNVADGAPGKFAALNIANAGSELTMPKLALGITVWFFNQTVY